MIQQRKRAAMMSAIAVLLLTAIAGSLLAAGENHGRSAILAGGGQTSQGSVMLQAAIGQPVAVEVMHGETTLCSGVACTAEAQPAHGGTIYTVTVSDFTFMPDPLEIEVGDTVVWQRLAGIHNVQADDGSFSCGSASSTWSTFERTFNTMGSFGYHCSVHGGPGTGMHGTIEVRTTPPTKVHLPVIFR